jgi:DNA-binding PadR family transcriptional regulator
MPLPSPPPPTPASPLDTWPGWAQAWREESGSYQRDVDVVIILGDTGIARREDVDELLAEWWGISSGSGSIGRAIIRVREAGLVEAIPSRRGRGRYPRHLLRLTERGQDIFRLLRGEAPASSQTTELLKRHKSPEHAALNLDAANRLWEAGYDVDLFPDSVALDTGTYYPDLAITTPEGRTFYVECERNTRKNPQERERKWALYYAASGGHFLVVTSSEEAGQAIQREILTWAGERPLSLWMASVEGQEAGLEWVDVRQGASPVSNIGD